MFRIHFGETTCATRIVEYHSVLYDVRDAVFELSKDVGTMIDAQTVTGTKVLIDPHSHPVRLRKDRDEHQDEQRDVSHNVAHTDRSLA